jgi:hypothetical protein
MELIGIAAIMLVIVLVFWLFDDERGDLLPRLRGERSLHIDWEIATSEQVIGLLPEDRLGAIRNYSEIASVPAEEAERVIDYLSYREQAESRRGYMNDKTNTFWKAAATTIVWTMLTGGFVTAFTFVGESLGEDIVGLAFIMLFAAVMVSGFIWNWGRIGDTQATDKQQHETDYQEKHKNDRLGQALRDLSNDELVRLRERLATGEIDERDLEIALGDDADRMRS